MVALLGPPPVRVLIKSTAKGQMERSKVVMTMVSLIMGRVILNRVTIVLAPINSGGFIDIIGYSRQCRQVADGKEGIPLHIGNNDSCHSPGAV